MISILLPTYNDAKHLGQAIQSVISQTYVDWELLVLDDGSEDNTKEVLGEFSDRRIRSFHQDNRGQLNALLLGAAHVRGDYVTLLHSDDELADEHALERNLSLIAGFDGLNADYLTMSEEEQYTSLPMGEVKSDVFKRILLSRGKNHFGDHFFVSRRVFEEKVLVNYLHENTIYLLDYRKIKALNIRKVPSWYRYRIGAENYIHQEIGKFVVYNGKARTIWKLFKKVSGLKPVIGKNEFLLRVFLKLGWTGLVTINRDPEDWKAKKQYFSSWQKHLQASGYPALSIQINQRTIHSCEVRDGGVQNKVLALEDLQGQPIYAGKDARSFYKDWKKGAVGFYRSLIEEDYEHISVPNRQSMEKVKEALKFYSLFYNVQIRNEEKI